jgi:hypothetical protein
MTVIASTPSSVPMTDPRPPESDVPPTTTAAMTSNSSPEAAPALPVPRQQHDGRRRSHQAGEHEDQDADA